MKNIILQHWSGKLGELEKLSIENIEAYADWCGAEHRLLRGPVVDARLAPQSQKIYAFNEEFDDHDIVVMMDTDMFVRKGMTKNIFTDEKGIGRHYKVQPRLVKDLARRYPLLGDPSYPYIGGSIYRLEKEVRQKLRPHFHFNEMIQFNNSYHDEGIIHRAFVLAQLKADSNTYLDRQQWNCSSFDEDEIHDANIIHIRPKVKPNGPKRPKIENYQSLKDRGII